MCYLTLRFDFTPCYLFGGVYIQPENSKYLSPNMFASLDSLLSRCTERCFTPYIGGDFNARLGDLNGLSPWKYSMNVDEYINRYGRIYMTGICRMNNVYPINQ